MAKKFFETTHGKIILGILALVFTVGAVVGLYYLTVAIIDAVVPDKKDTTPDKKDDPPPPKPLVNLNINKTGNPTVSGYTVEYSTGEDDDCTYIADYNEFLSVTLAITKLDDSYKFYNDIEKIKVEWVFTPVGGEEKTIATEEYSGYPLSDDNFASDENLDDDGISAKSNTDDNIVCEGQNIIRFKFKFADETEYNDWFDTSVIEWPDSIRKQFDSLDVGTVETISLTPSEVDNLITSISELKYDIISKTNRVFTNATVYRSKEGGVDVYTLTNTGNLNVDDKKFKVLKPEGMTDSFYLLQVVDGDGDGEYLKISFDPERPVDDGPITYLELTDQLEPSCMVELVKVSSNPADYYYFYVSTFKMPYMISPVVNGTGDSIVLFTPYTNITDQPAMYLHTYTTRASQPYDIAEWNDFNQTMTEEDSIAKHTFITGDWFMGLNITETNRKGRVAPQNYIRDNDVKLFDVTQEHTVGNVLKTLFETSSNKVSIMTVVKDDLSNLRVRKNDQGGMATIQLSGRDREFEENDKKLVRQNIYRIHKNYTKLISPHS